MMQGKVSLLSITSARKCLRKSQTNSTFPYYRSVNNQLLQFCQSLLALFRPFARAFNVLRIIRTPVPHLTGINLFLSHSIPFPP